MFLFSLKLCSWTSHFFIDRKGQFWHRFWEKPCMYYNQKEKIEIGNIVSDVNPEFWKKDERFVLNAIIRPSGDKS